MNEQHYRGLCIARCAMCGDVIPPHQGVWATLVPGEPDQKTHPECKQMLESGDLIGRTADFELIAV
jgi:hypothetical protein